ncbi:hypothetical protein [Kitasatospora cinereorecta]|uniref:Uncharacterized protein n=1 Tax=Kitasatospora cinereorecta TaxID=285560 RepID=A0ABW0VJS8_9ACTN
MTDRADRKRAELVAKVRGLQREFERWREESEEYAPLEKHHRQIRALTVPLDGAVKRLCKRVEEQDETVLSDWSQTEDSLLRIHEVWDFFREKFNLRYVQTFRPYLALADDFAAACYLPARDRSADPSRLREPPLTFLGGLSTPFAIPRGALYLGPSYSGVLTDEELKVVAERLPIPVVGLPWFQLDHLPDALVIGHEIGHHVEDDFALTDTFKELVEQALAAAGRPPASRRRWHGWLGEVFADVYGVLAAGPGFASALADFVPTTPEAMIGDAQYPPMALRVQVAAETLQRTGFAQQARAVLARWQGDFPTGPEEPYSDDADTVVQALLEGPYPQLGALPLTDVLTFRGRGQQAAAATRALLQSATLSPEIDVRTLLSAASSAFADEPQTYLENGLAAAVLKHARVIATRGLRENSAAPARQPTGRETSFDQALRELVRV